MNDTYETPELSRFLTDPRLVAILQEVVRERTNAARKRLPPRSKAMSGLSILEHPRLIRSRILVTFATGMLCIMEGVGLSRPFGVVSIWFASVACIASISLAALLVVELYKGAGTHVQTQYATANGFRRDYEFLPSLDSPLLVLTALVIIVASELLGFAAIYRSLSQQDPSSFSQGLTGLTALYFSAVTFATVGYGDIVPQTPSARLSVTLQIVSAYLLTTVVLATTVAWILSQRQHRMAVGEQRMRDQVEYNENLAKEARVGLYDREGEVKREVFRRARERGIPIDDLPTPETT